MYRNGTELKILIKNRPLDEYISTKLESFRDLQTFIEGRKGSEYIIQYRNNTAKRQKVVLSVDGLNVITGDNTWVRGYVVDPWATVEIPGWRQDSGNVAKFVFSSVGGSYNEHNVTGKVQNVGVIGCRVYNEKPEDIKIIHNYHYSYSPTPFWTYTAGSVGGGYVNPTVTYNTTVRSAEFREGEATMDCFQPEGIAMACSASINEQPQNAAPVQNVGTAWGETQKFETQSVSLNFESIVHATLLLYYDDRKGLERRGINVRQPVPSAPPNAFPGGDGCPPPV